MASFFSEEQRSVRSKIREGEEYFCALLLMRKEEHKDVLSSDFNDEPIIKPHAALNPFLSYSWL